MKKTTLILVALTLCLSLTSCAGCNVGGNKVATTTATATPTTNMMTTDINSSDSVTRTSEKSTTTDTLSISQNNIVSSSNMGLTAYDGDNLYYTDANSETLYKYSISSKETENILSTTAISTLFWDKGLLYFSESSGDKNNICTVDTNGKKSVLTTENDEINQLIVSDNKVFYSVYDVLKSVNLNGENKKILVNAEGKTSFGMNVIEFTINEKNIYYAVNEYNGNDVEQSKAKMYKSDLDGKNSKIVAEGMGIHSIKVADNKLYYLNATYKLSEESGTSRLDSVYVYNDQSVKITDKSSDTFLVYDNSIYTMESIDENAFKLCQIDMQGNIKKESKIEVSNCILLNVINNKILFVSMGKSRNIYSVDLDGSNVTEIK